MRDRMTARSLETIVGNMQDIYSMRLQPLMKLQDMLLYKLAALELQLQPLKRQVNQSLSHLKTIQYYIDNQGDKIAQLVRITLFDVYKKHPLCFGTAILFRHEFICSGIFCVEMSRYYKIFKKSLIL